MNPAADHSRLPQCLERVIQSSLNMLTAESLNRIVATNESDQVLSPMGFASPRGPANGRQIDSRMQQSSDEGSLDGDSNDFRYILFIWDGIETSQLTKANALAKAFELQALITKGKDAVLKVLFSGGVIRGKKLQRGSVYVLSDLLARDNTTATRYEDLASIDKSQAETFLKRILLLRCILPRLGADGSPAL